MYHPKLFHVPCSNEKCLTEAKDKKGNLIVDENGKPEMVRTSIPIPTPTSVSFDCPFCEARNEKTQMVVNIPNHPIVRTQVKPTRLIHVYKITTEEITAFLLQKLKLIKPNAMLKTHFQYSMNKQTNPPRSYSSLRIAFSEDVVKTDSNADGSWFESLGDNESNLKFDRNFEIMMISRYKYNKEILKTYLSDYKQLEKLEKQYGITESLLKDIIMYSTPRRIHMPRSKESWIFFAAEPAEVIKDYLSDPITDKLNGRLSIENIEQLNEKGSYQYTVFVHEGEGESEIKDNPEVREMLIGNNKKK